MAAKAYRVPSPVFLHDVSGRIMRLKGAGPVHAPTLDLTALSRLEIPMDRTAAPARIMPPSDAPRMPARARSQSRSVN